MRRVAEVGSESVATAVHRLGVLMSAGVSPASAWAHLAAVPDASDMVVAVAERIDRGLPVPEALLELVEEHAGGSADSWRALAAAWSVASVAGAPMASTLEALSGALRDLAQTRRGVETARAGPVATARLVMVLPFLGVFFGFALGFDTFGALFGSPIGLGFLAVGLGLMLTARAWNRRLLRGAEPGSNAPGLAFDLLAVALSGGASPGRANGEVVAAMRKCGIPDDELRATAATLELSRRAGVPAGVLLRAEAAEARRAARGTAERAAATLGITLMLPLGLCILPAFMLLGVAPLMLTIVESSFSGSSFAGF